MADRPVVLVGPMASGKTTIGELVARRTGRLLIDSDAAIEARTGSTAAEIAAAEGVDVLHRLEWQVLAEAVASGGPVVVAAAASVADRPELTSTVADRAVLVWVEAEPEVLADRRGSGDHRRAVDERAHTELTARRRRRVVAAADLVVDTGGAGADAVAARIVQVMHATLQRDRPAAALASKAPPTEEPTDAMASFATARRVVIENVHPSVDGGRFPAKRVVGDEVEVTADVFCDGHDAVACVVRYRFEGERWQEAPMQPLGNDAWRAAFPVDRVGTWWFTVVGWVDHFATWRRGLEKKADAGVDVATDLLIGAELVAAAADRARGEDAEALADFAGLLADQSRPAGERTEVALHPALASTMAANPDRSRATTLEQRLPLIVDRERARFSTWYELFPRSWGEGTDHGTLSDVADRLDYVAEMGFDVLYLPPIHPIGTTKRKGPNNALEAGPDDPGVPWAIGSPEGGHTAIHPELGTIDDFRKLRDRASELGMELALDVAFQCSPDHPWVTEHPEWFRHRPDGSIQYAENPPKRYEDIYPIDFETSDPEGLWTALKGVFEHWLEEGVRIFRVDNPHTKAFAFWEWCIAELRSVYPDVIFLSEAFTRPKVMYRLAKLGFTQSYTYFAWRNTPWELREYLTELTRPPVVDFFRPNFWPNTPDILTAFLQSGGKPAFRIRLVLAATLTASYGIYGPAFELCEHTPRQPGSEEYRDSEKYQIRDWDLDRPDSLAPLVGLVNRIRREHPALQANRSLAFHDTDNDMLLAYSKTDGDDIVLCVVNLDPHHTQSGWTDLDLDTLGVEAEHPFLVHDLLTDQRFLWTGARNFVMLDPQMPAHVFAVRPRVRTEEDFDYFM